jgi:hypothetical protein
VIAKAVADITVECVGIGTFSVRFIYSDNIIKLVLVDIKGVCRRGGILARRCIRLGWESIFCCAVSGSVTHGSDVAVACVGVYVFDMGGGAVGNASIDSSNSG